MRLRFDASTFSLRCVPARRRLCRCPSCVHCVTLLRLCVHPRAWLGGHVAPPPRRGSGPPGSRSCIGAAFGARAMFHPLALPHRACSSKLRTSKVLGHGHTGTIRLLPSEIRVAVDPQCPGPRRQAPPSQSRMEGSEENMPGYSVLPLIQDPSVRGPPRRDWTVHTSPHLWQV